jgi:metal-dependent amidase/aminoacylase/carboxypeptidase family protein
VHKSSDYYAQIIPEQQLHLVFCFHEFHLITIALRRTSHLSIKRIIDSRRAVSLPSPDQHHTRLGNEFRPQLDPFESIYKDLHQSPEISCRESQTAKIAAKNLKKLKYQVRENIGGHGLVGILDNGPGPTILLRAEMDALPVLEKTGLPYAIKVTMKDDDGEAKPVMHACGHDMHMACLMAAAKLLHTARGKWRGRLLCLFQPNEERAGGAQAMIDDGLYQNYGFPVPDVVLGMN